MRCWPLASAACAALALAAVPASGVSAAAQLARGSTLTFTGTADATDIGLGGVVLDFSGPVTAGAAGNTGAFASLNRPSGAGLSGHIADVRVGNGAQRVRNFFVLGGYRFDLLSLPSGGYGQDACYTEDFAVGQTCTPYQSVQGKPEINDGLSPFYVANVYSGDPEAPINSTAAFDLFGTVTGPGGARSYFTGTIASTFVGLPYQYVLWTLENDGLPDVTFTGTFTVGGAATGTAGETVAPEPGTYALVAAGLVGTAAAARRRRRS